jgi:hypothetical protein
VPQKVGVGTVEQACAFALMLRGSACEIVLVDGTAERATALAHSLLRPRMRACHEHLGDTLAFRPTRVSRPG